jgi:CRP/FNR family transcriptional regulator
MISLKDFFEPELTSELNRLPILEIESNQYILKEGSFIKEIPILIEGSIKVRKTDESGREIVLYHVYPGESCILSITSCLNEKLSNAEALTVKKSKLIVVNAAQVRDWMDKYKSWRQFVMKLYYQRIDEVLTLVDHIAFKQVDFRLIEKLKEKKLHHGTTLEITHQQLANELGTAREVVSRLLKQLEKQGSIELDRGIIKIIGNL